MLDEQDLAGRLAGQAGGLAEGIGEGDEVVTLVVGIAGVLAGAVLVALELGEGVPPQVLAPLVGVDDRVRQAIGTVEVFGDLAFGVGLGDELHWSP